MKEMERFQRAVEGFAAAHREDPRMVETLRGRVPRSVLYHDRLVHWLQTIEPEASEALRLAAHCQHIRRWRVPRSEYPEGKIGYRKWRGDLAVMHGEEAAGILRDAGYPEETIERCRELLLKKDLKTDPEAQALEDAICLVFLENELRDFAAGHDEDKLVMILRKTWGKMSAKGHAAALRLAENLPADLQKLIARATGLSRDEG